MLLSTVRRAECQRACGRTDRRVGERAAVHPDVSHPNTSSGKLMSAATPSTSEHEQPARSLEHPVVEWINDWGGVVVDGMSAVGDFTLFVWRTLVWLFTRLPRRETLLPNFYQVGVLSLPVVALTGTFIGMVLAVQSHFQFSQIGLETRLGAVINMSLVRELGSGAGGHHAGRPRGQCHGGRAGDDAGDGAD